MGNTSLTVLILSNGFGEDLIGAHLAQALQRISPHVTLYIYPLVGSGHEYKKQGFTPLFDNPTFPSGGFIRSFKTLFTDIKGGIVAHHLSQRKQLKKITPHVDITLCIGDVFCLVMAKLSAAQNIHFLPTAKSDTFMPHSPIEYWIMRKWASYVFPRDAQTCEALLNHNVLAVYLGTVMFDKFTPKGDTFPINDTSKVIALLPGSREEAYANFQHMCKVADTLATHNPNLAFILAKADSLDLNRLKENTPSNWTYKKTYFEHTQGAKLYVSSSFPDVLNNTHLCIGLSGTANEQAIHAGKPVFCYEGFGPQSTRQRFQEQQLLMDGKLNIIHPRSIPSICEQIEHALENETLQKKLAPQQNSASEKIIKYILNKG